jgi:succinate dehydrogenase / fumarate reductase, cytochrome b subunit
MQWIVTYLTSSIGKKQIMGATGAMIALWIFGHMVGNTQLLNMDPAAAQAHYNAYSELLTKSKAFLYGQEAVFGFALLAHIYLAISLKMQNKKARGPVGYEVNARKGKKSFATFTMIFSGLFILAFVASHLLALKFGTYYYYQNPEVAGGKIVRDMWLTTSWLSPIPLSPPSTWSACSLSACTCGMQFLVLSRPWASTTRSGRPSSKNWAWPIA